MIKFEIEMPLFRGFLDHQVKLTDTLCEEYRSNEEYYRETYGKALLISEDTIELNDEAYQRAVCDLYIKWFCERFEELVPGFILEMRYKDLESPQFYQYETDRLYVDVCLADDWRERLTSFMTQNQKWLTDRILEDWTSGSGFISKMSNDYNFWKKELEQLLPDRRYISELIGYMAEVAEPGFGKKLNDDVFNEVSISDYVYFKQAICVPDPECVFQPEEEGIMIETRDGSSVQTSRIRIDDERFSKILKKKATRREYHGFFKNRKHVQCHIKVLMYDDMDDVQRFIDEIMRLPVIDSRCGLNGGVLRVNRGGVFDENTWMVKGGKWSVLSKELRMGFMFDEVFYNRHEILLGKCGERYYCMESMYAESVPSLEIAGRVVRLIGVSPKRKGTIVVSVGEKGMQIIDNDGKPLSEVYDRIDVFVSEDFCQVSRYGHWGLLNRKFEEQIGVFYDEPVIFSEGLAVVKYKGRYGVINENDTEVVPFEMDYAHFSCYHNGYASMENEEHEWGTIDREGNVVIPCMYARPVIFDKKGIASVRVENEDGDEDCFDIDTKNNRV